MEDNYNNMSVGRLRALAREHGLRGYSRLRKAELITFLRENLSAQEPVENHQPVGRTRARPLRRSKSPELPRETTFNSIRRSKSLELPCETTFNSIHHSKSLELPCETTFNSIRRSRSLEFKPPLVRPRRRPQRPIRPPPPPPNYFQPHQLEQAFRGAYISYRINGRPRMDADTFFNRIRRELIELIRRELRTRTSARIQTNAWIRFVIRDNEEDGAVEMAFNSRMTSVYQGSI